MKNKNIELIKYLMFFIVVSISPWTWKIITQSPFYVSILVLLISIFLIYLLKRDENKSIYYLLGVINIVLILLTLPKSIDSKIYFASRLEKDTLTRRFDIYAKDLGKIYMNRYGIFYHYNIEPVLSKYSVNLFENIDINAYFFGSHPREQGLGNEFIKFSVLFSPLFIVGFIASLTKKKGIAMLFGVNLVLSALYSTGYKPGPLLLYPYFVFFIAYGFRICLEKSYLLIKRY